MAWQEPCQSGCASNLGGEGTGYREIRHIGEECNPCFHCLLQRLIGFRMPHIANACAVPCKAWQGLANSTPLLEALAVIMV